MAITMTAREFNQNASLALKLSEKEPVFITKWGKIVSVVSSYINYQEQTLAEPSFEQLFSPTTYQEEVSDEFFDDFEHTLTEIRRNSRMRIVEFED